MLPVTPPEPEIPEKGSHIIRGGEGQDHRSLLVFREKASDQESSVGAVAVLVVLPGTS